MAFREIDIRGLSLNPFTRFGDDWALVTAGDESGLNTMTVSWGQMGTLWGRDVVTVYIRPSRHTKAFVDAAERFLHGLGFGQLRVRVHEGSGDLARVEVLPEELDRLCSPGVRDAVKRRLRELGFAYVSVDLEGFRSGSMNEALPR